MDKEPTVTGNWLWALVGGGLAIIAWRWRLWLGAILSALVLSGIYVVHLEITDPFVGPAIQKEAGQRYVTQFYWSALVGCTLQVIAVCHGMKVWWASRTLDV